MAHTIHIHRDQIEWASGVCVLAGFGAIVAPFLAGAEGQVVFSNGAAGLLTMLLGATVGMALGADEHTSVSWVIAGLGTWVAVSGLVLGAPLGLVMGNLLIGGVIAAHGALCAVAGTRPYEGPMAARTVLDR